MNTFFQADGHVHFDHGTDLSFLKGYLELGFRHLNLVALPGAYGRSQTQNMLGALMKLEDDRFFCSASLMYEEAPVLKPLSYPFAFEIQVKELADIGFDGMKMLEGKPGPRKRYGVSPADEIYDPYFTELEATGRHIVWHVNDPENFWTDRAPAFARENGWTYEDGTYPTYQQLYDEVYEVLDNHPKLNATFAHFFFHSAHPAEMIRLFDTYENIAFDITPGREMYEDFSRDPKMWHDLFTKYATRFVFGSDMDTSLFQGTGEEVTGTIWRFLTTSDSFRFWDIDFHGLALDEKVVDLICGGNFYRRIGHAKPNPIDRKALAAYIDRWLPLVSDPEDREFILAGRSKL